jgi:hypothetical protein
MPGPANLVSKVAFWSFQVGQPSAILILPALVNRMPPKTSSIYPSSISRALCSDGMRCIKPLAPSRNETNSSRVNGGADGAILGICAYGRPDQAGIRRFPRWPVSDGLQGGNAPAALLESHAASFRNGCGRPSLLGRLGARQLQKGFGRPACLSVMFAVAWEFHCLSRTVLARPDAIAGRQAQRLAEMSDGARSKILEGKQSGVRRLSHLADRFQARRF